MPWERLFVMAEFYHGTVSKMSMPPPALPETVELDTEMLPALKMPVRALLDIVQSMTAQALLLLIA